MSCELPKHSDSDALMGGCIGHRLSVCPHKTKGWTATNLSVERKNPLRKVPSRYVSQKGKVVFQPPFFRGRTVKLRGVSFLRCFGRWISRVSDVLRPLAGDYTDRLVPGSEAVVCHIKHASLGVEPSGLQKFARK